MAETMRLAEVDGPHDHDAEKALLGGLCLLDPAEVGRVWTIRSVVAPSDFHDHRNRLFYEVLLSLAERGESIDAHTLGRELKARGRFNTIGGSDYLSELFDATITTQHLDAHARLVADAATARRLVVEAQRMVSRASSGASLDELQGAARRCLEVSTAVSQDDLASIGDAAKDEESRLLASDDQGVITTGLATLDRALAGGFWGGQTIVIGARPSVGKSAVGIRCALAAAMHCAERAEGVVAFISVEMPRRSIASRAACIKIALASPANPVDLMSVRQKQLSTFDAKRYSDALDAMQGLPLLISDKRDVTPSRARALCLQARARYGRVALIVVDYLQKMKPDTAYDSREREVAETSRIFSALAGELSCPVVLLSQLNRKATERRPTMADLRESGAIEQDADVILLLHKEGQRRDIMVEKQRDGATTDEPVPLGWIASAACYVDAGVVPEASHGARYDEPQGMDDEATLDDVPAFNSFGGDAE